MWLPILVAPFLLTAEVVTGYEYREVQATAVVASVGAAICCLLFVTGIALVRLRRRLAKCEHRIEKLEKELQPSEVRMG